MIGSSVLNDTILTSCSSSPKLTGLAYLPRWLGGVSCYITFGLGGLLSSFTILPLLKCWPGTPEQKVKRVQKTVHIMFRIFVHMLTWAGVIKVVPINLERLSLAKGKVHVFIKHRARDT